jgi:Carbon starvation protein, predicted membrane protein
MNNVRTGLIWLAVALIGAAAFAMLALSRGEHVNAVWLVIASVACYSIAYRFYSLFIARRIFELDDRRRTPAERFNDGLDYVPTNKWVLFGPPLCRNRWCRSAGRADPGGADGFSARHHLDSGRRDAGRRGAGFSGAVYLHAPRRSFAG